MTRQPRAFFALDLGSATTSVAIVGHLAGRWRLVAHLAVPATSDVEAALTHLVDRVLTGDPELAGELAPSAAAGFGAAPAASRPGAQARGIAESWPRVECRTTPRRVLAVVAGSKRGRRRLEEVALRAGWDVVGGSAEEDDAFCLSRLALDPSTDAVLLGADDPPAGDERRHLPQLAALIAAAARRRPELEVVLAGGAAAQSDVFAEMGLGRREAHHGLRALAELPALHRSGPHQTRPEPAAARQGEEPPSGAADRAGSEASAAAAEQPRGATGETTEGERASAQPASGSSGRHVVEASDRRPPRDVLLAPEPSRGHPPGSALRLVLEGLRVRDDDSRVAIARSTASLAFVLDRSVEVVEIGLQAGLRSRAEPLPGDGRGTVAASHATVAAASLAPPDPSDAIVDGVLGWSTVVLDRYRLADRLRDLRLSPWAELDGDGALLRLAAARAALQRLVDATPEITNRPAPDLLVAAGGAWATVPPPVVGLALADLVRRSGVSQLALDAGRLLGPLGTIEDEHERRRVLADLADDLLVPLGSVIMPGSLRSGRSAGRLVVRDVRTSAEPPAAEAPAGGSAGAGGATGRAKGSAKGSATSAAQGAGQPSGLDLQPGGIEVVDLPPGQTAIVELDFRETVRLGARGRHFATEVTGGLGGLLVDLRDIPLRLPERADARRALLDGWQRALWSEIDR